MKYCCKLHIYPYSLSNQRTGAWIIDKSDIMKQIIF
jgi:hypothetical protein